MTPDLKRAERKLYDTPTAEHLHAAAQLSTGTASKYLSDDIVQRLELAYIAEWLARLARHDNPAAHAQTAADAVGLVFSWWHDRA
ncbi:MAG: hypothetical protein EBR82_81350 [Caulobacteraceae bacterium]|nr:hypothetical protein [Caulobacteraceae bacterium]